MPDSLELNEKESTVVSGDEVPAGCGCGLELPSRADAKPC